MKNSGHLNFQKKRGEKTGLYKRALMDCDLFPPGIYDLQNIYDTFINADLIPREHFTDRQDVKYPLWKNYIHSERPKSSAVCLVTIEDYYTL
ncbi:hypothetical protein D3C74_48590 [compost metagenome]